MHFCLNTKKIQSMRLSIFPSTGKRKQRGLILLEQGHCKHTSILTDIFSALPSTNSPHQNDRSSANSCANGCHYKTITMSIVLPQIFCVLPARDTWKQLTTFLHAHNKATATSSLTCMTTFTSMTWKTMQAAISTPYLPMACSNHPHVTPPSITCFTQPLLGTNLSWMDPTLLWMTFNRVGSTSVSYHSPYN